MSDIELDLDLDLMSDVGGSFSHSQLRAWLQCRMKWHLNYERNLTAKTKSTALAVGSFMHELLEEYYERVKEGKDCSWESISNWISETYPLPNDEDAFKSFAHALAVYKRYIEDYSPNKDRGWTPIHVEYKSEFTLTTPDGLKAEIVYIPDVIMRHESGKLWIWDHKTFRSKPMSETDLQTEVQIPIYIAAVRRDLGLDIHGALFNMINVYEYKNFLKEPLDKIYLRKRAYRTPTEIENTVNLVGTQIDDLRANSNRIFMNRHTHCSWCEFENYCTTLMKGLDGEEILNSNFTQKRKASSDNHSENPESGKLTLD